MTIYIVTHPEKGSGANPSLTEPGRRQIAKLPIPNDIKLLVAGTGARFYHTLECIVGILERQNGGNRINIPMKFSPLCGSADSGEKSETGFEVILADGTVLQPGEYLGLIGTPGIDLKVWLDSLPDGTLLCAGREFLGGIGYQGGEPARLYAYENGVSTLIA